MVRSCIALSWVGLLLVPVLLAGCDSSASKAKPVVVTPVQPSSSQEKPSAQAEALAKLSPEDRAAAEAQKICPVSGEALGSMDVPIKMTVNGQDVFLCCEGCAEDLKKDPEKFLARLKK